jgi:hypothetical protein
MCKKPYPTYADALKALYTTVSRPELGSACPCDRCDAWHISSRRFTLTRTRGRGGARRGVVFK